MSNIATFGISETVENIVEIKGVADIISLLVAPTTFSETMVIVLQYIC